MIPQNIGFVHIFFYSGQGRFYLVSGGIHLFASANFNKFRAVSGDTEQWIPFMFPVRYLTPSADLLSDAVGLLFTDVAIFLRWIRRLGYNPVFFRV